jgi:hypothetical protein
MSQIEYAYNFEMWTYDILLNTSDSETVFETKHFKNMIFNSNAFINSFEKSLNSLQDFTAQDIANTKNIILVILIAWSIFVFILFLIQFFIIKNRISQDKIQMYFALTTLPKSCISKVSGKLGVLKNQSRSEELDDVTKKKFNKEEYTKQEENFLKVFATIENNNQFIRNDSWMILILFFFPSVISIVFVDLWMAFLLNSGNQLISSIHHIESISSMYIYDLMSISNIQITFLLDNNISLNTNLTQTFFLNDSLE